MQFLVILLLASLALWALPARFGGRSPRDAMRRSLAVALIFAGLSHFATRELFVAHFPDWVPVTEAIVYASGLLEVVAGLALFANRYRERVGQALAIYLLLVLPANVYVAVAGVDVPGLPDAAWYHWARLPMQALFVWWALRSTAPPAAGGVRTTALARTGALP